MQIKFSPPDITEEEISEVVDTLKSGWITTGPKTKCFEEKIATYCGVNRAVCLNSATAGLELTLRMMGIGQGDEVITSAYTYTATASVIAHLGATIILVDTQPDSVEMDYEQMGRVITEKTKAIIPIDIAGILCDYEKIYQVIEEHQCKFKAANPYQEILGRPLVLADGAHSFGAHWNHQKSGSIADFTAFSFHAVKNLTTGEGGAVTWRNDLGFSDHDIYQQYMLMSLHGQNKDALAKTKQGAWEYDVVAPYYKCNMTDISASIGLIQLKRYEGLLKKRHHVIAEYNRMLKEYQVQVLNHVSEAKVSSGHLYFVRLLGKEEKDRNLIIEKMSEKGIPCNVHYKPLPLLSAYRNYGFHIADYPNAYSFYKNVLTLPLHTHLTEEEVLYISKSFLDIISE